MKNPSNDVIKYEQPGALQATVKQDEWHEVKQHGAKEAISAASSLVKLLIDGGSVFVDNQRLNGQAEAEWKHIQSQMAQLDNKTQNVLKVMEGELKQAQNKTEQFQRLTTMIQTLDSESRKVLAPGINEALSDFFKS